MVKQPQDDGSNMPSLSDQLRQFTDPMRYRGNIMSPIEVRARFPIVQIAVDDLPIRLNQEERIAFVEYLFAEMVYLHRHAYLEGRACPCTKHVAHHRAKYVNISYCIAALRLGYTTPSGQRFEALEVSQVADLVINGSVLDGNYSYRGLNPVLRNLGIDPLTAKTCAAIYLGLHKNGVVENSISERLAPVIESSILHWQREDELFQQARARVLARPEYATKLLRPLTELVLPDQVPGTDEGNQISPAIAAPRSVAEIPTDRPQQAADPDPASLAPLAEPPPVVRPQRWHPRRLRTPAKYGQLALISIPVILVLCATLLVNSSSATQEGGTISSLAGAPVQSRNLGALPQQLSDGAPRWYLLDVAHPLSAKQVVIFDRVRHMLYPLWPDDHLDLWNAWLDVAHFLTLPTISTSAYAPTTQELAFAMKANDTTSIWIAHLDVKDLRLTLTYLPQLVLRDCAGCTTLSWSPHGRLLLFNSAKGLRALTLATHTVTILTTDGQDAFPACSHDGQHLAYQSAQKTIWVLTTTHCLPAVPLAAAIRELADISPAWHAAWSTDDSRLYFASTYAGNGAKIYSVAAADIPLRGASPQIPPIMLISGTDDCLDPDWSAETGQQIGYLIYLCATQDNGTKSTRLMILADPALAPAATPTAIPLPTMAYHPQALSTP